MSWDAALDDIAGRIRRAMEEERRDEIMYHVGRPGEDGFTERVVANWGIDGHNSHTNICSSGARSGYHFWMGMDRPSPDHANAEVILLISSHLETGHYFNPHAQRIIEAKKRGARLIVLDTRLSNTATHADLWLSSYPGSEAAILLAVANHLIQNDLHDAGFVERWWNWREYLQENHPEAEPTFERFQELLKGLYAEYTFEYAAAESGISVARLRRMADIVAGAGTRLSTHNWRSASAGNLGGWQVARSLFMLNALLGAVAVPGATYPNAWNKFVPRPIHPPQHPKHWNELTWPREYPLALMEMSFLLPHIVKERKKKIDVYFTRVYNPVWTNPDGFSWIEMLTDPEKIGLHVALTPTWNETAYFADYVLPMGNSAERHDITSYEQYDGRWIAFRQPVLRTARRRLGEELSDTRSANPGEVWEENQFWIEMTWRIDPDGALGIRSFFESKKKPGEKLTVDEYYGWMFENSVPGLPEAAAAEGLTPLEYMRRYGAFEVDKTVGPVYEEEVPESELEEVRVDGSGRAYSRAPAASSSNVVPLPPLEPDGEGRRRAGVEVDGSIRRGWPTPSGRLEFWSSTLARWGWPEQAIPAYSKSHIHPHRIAEDQKVLISTFRLPVQIHTRSANSKWLNEIAHTNPLWIHPNDASPLRLETGDLVRVETEIGHFIVKAWVTEGIHPGVVACSHHMGRWKLHEGEGSRFMMPVAGLERSGSEWRLVRKSGVKGGPSSDPDTRRIWWTDAGVHQNMTFPVQPDPVSGQHCWHQAVRIRPAGPGDRYGDISVDTAKAHAAYQRWLELTRPANRHSPTERGGPTGSFAP